MDQFQRIIDTGILPDDFSAPLQFLLEGEQTFISQEGINWDFKVEWPFSYSDEYFGGIARLFCAFSNTRGGLAIFGVHDKHRTGGHNKVPPNADKLQKALDQLLSARIQFSVRHYTTSAGAIDVVLVLPRPSSDMPVRFTQTISTYQAGTIWVRDAHEVVSAEPRHIGILYCRTFLSTDDSDDLSTGRGLPPSHAIVKTFVGRMPTIDAVFEWIKMRDEPRSFLYGKGGSGKTTIAYEVAKTLSACGKGFAIQGNEVLDNVMFISAKQQSLNPDTGKIEQFVGREFQNERELYQAILTRGNWTAQSLEGLSLEYLKKEVRDFFDLTSNFIVIDDVDTLTTKGVEAGFDFLQGVLWRAKRHSKILYTLRNVPAQSITNSIEVPGLSPGGEYEEFVHICAQQFRAPAPLRSFVNGRLAVISERRPLVIELIVALSRNAGSYERALQLFEQHSGDDVRRYVFQREWDALAADNYARQVLAIIALNAEPITFSDLSALTRYDDGRVKDAVSEIREMFLTIGTAGQETTYSLAALTSAFVLEEARKLDTFAQLRARVEQYKKKVFPENPLLSRLRYRVEGLLEKGQKTGEADLVAQAWSAVLDPTISPRIVEDPRFIALQGYVAAKQLPPKLTDARRFFEHAFAMKFEPEFEYLKEWFYAEKHSGYGADRCLQIADFIATAKRYPEREKLYIQQRKATLLFARAKEDRFNTPEKAIGEISLALRTHINCYEQYRKAGDFETDKSEEFSQNTAYFLFDFLVRSAGYDDFFGIVAGLLTQKELCLDVIALPLLTSFGWLAKTNLNAPLAGKIRGRILELKRELDVSPSWRDLTLRASVAELAIKASHLLAQRFPRK